MTVFCQVWGYVLICKYFIERVRRAMLNGPCVNYISYSDSMGISCLYSSLRHFSIVPCVPSNPIRMPLRSSTLPFEVKYSWYFIVFEMFFFGEVIDNWYITDVPKPTSLESNNPSLDLSSIFQQLILTVMNPATSVMSKSHDDDMLLDTVPVTRIFSFLITNSDKRNIFNQKGLLHYEETCIERQVLLNCVQWED